MSALIGASAGAFTAVERVGACYPICVGVRELLERDVQLRAARGTQRRSFTQRVVAVTAGTLAGVFRRRRRALGYGSAAVFIGLGTRAALTKRN